jgi:hypothetical protein
MLSASRIDAPFQQPVTGSRRAPRLPGRTDEQRQQRAGVGPGDLCSPSRAAGPDVTRLSHETTSDGAQRARRAECSSGPRDTTGRPGSPARRFPPAQPRSSLLPVPPNLLEARPNDREARIVR